MAQSANKRSPLEIAQPGTRLQPTHLYDGKSAVSSYKIALVAKENIILGPFLVPKPEIVENALEPLYEETIVGSSTKSEREGSARNAQQKMNWQKQMSNLIKIGKMWGENPWPLADQKTVYLLHLSSGAAGRKIVNCKIFHIMTDTQTSAEFGKIVEVAFIRPRNITFDIYVFLITKTFRLETVENFYANSTNWQKIAILRKRKKPWSETFSSPT